MNDMSVQVRGQGGAATAQGAPQCVLLFLPSSFDWLFSKIVPMMRERHGMRFVFVTNGEERTAFARSFAGADDEFIDINVVEDAAAALPVDPERDFSAAQAFEHEFGVNYMRDIIYSDRALATRYFSFAPNSAYARVLPPQHIENVKRVNYFLRYFSDLMRQKRIDLVIERPGSLSVSSCLHAATGLGIPTTFPRTSRIGAQVLWSQGPFVDSEPFERAYRETPEQEPIPADQVGPPDYIVQFNKTDEQWRSVRFLARRFVTTAIDQAIFAWRAWSAGRRMRRLSYLSVRRQDVAKIYLHQYLNKAVVADKGTLTARPFVLFLLQLEPEYSTLSLAKEFNETEAAIRQLSLSLPVGINLVVKEHVSAIGNREAAFYKRVKKLPNVILADHRLPGIALARDARAVATITGTIGVEATLLGKPAIIFGRHTEYGFLPSVEVVTDFGKLPEQVERATRERTWREIDDIRRSGARYLKAMAAISFQRPADAYSGKGFSMGADEAARAANLLVDGWRTQMRNITSKPLQP